MYNTIFNARNITLFKLSFTEPGILWILLTNKEVETRLSIILHKNFYSKDKIFVEESLK